MAAGEPPLATEAAAGVDDDFARFPTGPRVANWNTYQPRWAGVRAENGSLKLTDRDPYDYASATRVFPPAKSVSVELAVVADQADRGRLEIDLFDHFGSACPVRLAFSLA